MNFDDVDVTNRTPRAAWEDDWKLPAVDDVPPLPAQDAADGTRTKLGAAPPPIPSAALRRMAGGTEPPASSSVMTTPALNDVDVPVDDMATPLPSVVVDEDAMTPLPKRTPSVVDYPVRLDYAPSASPEEYSVPFPHVDLPPPAPRERAGLPTPRRATVSQPVQALEPVEARRVDPLASTALAIDGGADIAAAVLAGKLPTEAPLELPPEPLPPLPKPRTTTSGPIARPQTIPPRNPLASTQLGLGHGTGSTSALPDLPLGATHLGTPAPQRKPPTVPPPIPTRASGPVAAPTTGSAAALPLAPSPGSAPIPFTSANMAPTTGSANSLRSTQFAAPAPMPQAPTGVVQDEQWPSPSEPAGWPLANDWSAGNSMSAAEMSAAATQPASMPMRPANAQTLASMMAVGQPPAMPNAVPMMVVPMAAPSGPHAPPSQVVRPAQLWDAAQSFEQSFEEQFDAEVTAPLERPAPSNLGRNIGIGVGGAVALVAILFFAFRSSGSDTAASAQAVKQGAGVVTYDASNDPNAAKIANAATATTNTANVATTPPATTKPATTDATATTQVATTDTPTTTSPTQTIDVAITSQPAGAQVTLVDNGKMLPIGVTPMAVTLDPSREYDVILTLDNKPTRIEHLRPGANKLAVNFSQPQTEVAAAPTPAPAPAHVATQQPKPATQQPKPATQQPKPATPAQPKPAQPAVAKAPPTTETPAGNSGTLAISTKPPCEIIIDGHATGKTTPQRSLALAPGRHTIKMVNKSQSLSRTVTVSITAGQVTRLIQSLE